MKENIEQDAQRLQSQLVSWRRKLHQIPEVGVQLPQTMDFIKQELDKMGISYHFYEEISCIEATLGQGKKCFLLRSDVDALPVQEEADVPFRSTNGNMHGCGHDLHGAILLGAAKLLKDREKELPGRVKLLFQSGEEVFQGAKAAVEAGVLRDVQAAFAAHVIAMMPVGSVLTGKEAMASVDGFEITIIGKGGHGSMPEAAIDPINGAVQVYLALQSLIAREVAGTEEAVLTVGQLAAGEVANVIPEKAVLQGTLRTFKPELRRRLVERIQQVAFAVAEAYRCGCEYRAISQCDSVVTDDEVTALVAEVIGKVEPSWKVVQGAHGMGSEDFAQITREVPAAYYMIGAGPEQERKRYGQHNPKIEFNEDVLHAAAAIYAQTAIAWLEKKGENDEL